MTKTKAKEGQEEKHDDHYYKKGLWTVEEDKLLVDYVKVHGKGQWNRIAKITGIIIIIIIISFVLFIYLFILYVIFINWM